MRKLSKIFHRLGRGGGGGGGAGGPYDETTSHGGSSTGSDYRQLTSKRWRRGAVNGETGHADVFRKGTLKTGTATILADGSPGASEPCAVCARIDFARLLDWQPGDARPWISLAHTACSVPVRRRTAERDDDAYNNNNNNERRTMRSRVRRRRSFDSNEDDEYATEPEEEEEDESDGPELFPPPSQRASVLPPPIPCPWCTFFQAMISTEVDGGGEAAIAGAGAGVKSNGSVRSKFTPYLRIRLAFERLGGGEKHQLGKSVLFEVTTRNRSLPWGYIIKAVPEGADRPGSPTVMLRGRKIAPFLDPGLLTSWMRFCEDQHRFGRCGELKESTNSVILIPGLKLIDCEARRVVLAEELREGEGEGDVVEYATLSYVRDSLDGLDGRDDTEEGGSTRRSLDELPPLIADAMAVAESMRIRYLWVDRYCMPSKREAARDPSMASIRRSQIEMMGRIFSQSTLTLIVAAGEGVHSGIPGVSIPREEQLSLKTQTDLFTTTLLRPDLEVATSAWASRAWTYQEGLLSRRRLVFTPWQTYFQCQALHCHESVVFPLHLSPGLNLGRVFPAADEPVFRLSRFSHHIKTFMAKSLAHDEDRLDAFRGILHEYAHANAYVQSESESESLAVNHILGLPLFHPESFANVAVVSQTDRLAVALGWMVGPAVPTPQDDCDRQTTIDPYYLLDTPPCPFPSWTWLSWRLQAGRDSSYEAPIFNFRFNLVGDANGNANGNGIGNAAPLMDGVTAAPGMEASVGFADGMVLSWEIDGDAISRKAEAERIEFLRLKTFCFDLEVGKPADERSTVALALAEPVASILGKAAADTVEAWVRRCSVTVLPALVGEEAPREREVYQLMGLLVSGRNWRASDGMPYLPLALPGTHTQSTPGTAGTPLASSTSTSTSSATVLVCGRRNWEPEAPLIRLGVLSINFTALDSVAGEGGEASRSLATSRCDAAAAILRCVEGGKRDLPVRLREVDVY